MTTTLWKVAAHISYSTITDENLMPLFRVTPDKGSTNAMEEAMQIVFEHNTHTAMQTALEEIAVQARSLAGNRLTPINAVKVGGRILKILEAVQAIQSRERQ